jgi:hypothetical protein
MRQLAEERRVVDEDEARDLATTRERILRIHEGERLRQAEALKVSTWEEDSVRILSQDEY